MMALRQLQIQSWIILGLSPHSAPSGQPCEERSKHHPLLILITTPDSQKHLFSPQSDSNWCEHMYMVMFPAKINHHPSHLVNSTFPSPPYTQPPYEHGPPEIPLNLQSSRRRCGSPGKHPPNHFCVRNNNPVGRAGKSECRRHA